MSDHSHGFRPKRGCHTALREIYQTWHGTTWLIEGDISPGFDKLDHELVLNTLSEDIHDQRFIQLMQDLFEAGYLEDWTFNQTLSGVPQGGIGSPLLANILLNKLDKWGETVLIPRYTKGNRKKAHPEYHNLLKDSPRQRRKGNVQKAEEWRKQAQMLPSQKTNDPDYRRLKYVRYADDFVRGFTGPKSEAEEIKPALREFLREELKLDLSKEKTLMTHAKSEAARFLGYEVTINQKETKRGKIREGYRRRTINGQIGLRVPKQVSETKCEPDERSQEALHRAEMVQESDVDIISKSQAEYRGIANYYRLAYNMHALGKLKWVMETSLTKTLAHKFHVAVPTISAK